MSEKTKNNTKSFFRQMADDLVEGPAVYLVSILVPLIIMIVVFAMRNIFPFGENCYLRSDMYHQYCPFFSELWEKLRTGDSLFYSWDIGMGSNFTAVFGYYLSSPTNWFIALFPQKYMIEIMNVIILLKLAASSFTCTFYLCKRQNRVHLSSAIFGMFYALSAYIAAYSWNLMWLDCVLLLPLVILGLERLVKEGKGLMYVISLGLSILSNYYIAIMVCVSAVVYFIVYMVSMERFKDPMDYVKAMLRFGLYSILAGALAAILLLPEISALGYSASGNVNFPDTWTRYFSFITMIKRELLNVNVSIGLDHMPNIYCGVAVFLLFPMYIMTKKIPMREKIMKVIALIVFFTAFNLNILNFMWHGLHYPNSLPCRQSFIYIFLLLTICHDAISEIQNYKGRQVTGVFWGVMLLLLFIGNTLTDDDGLSFNALYISAIFIAVYALFMILTVKRKMPKKIAILLVYALSIVEVTVNMANTGYSTTNRTAYLRDYDAVESVVDYMYKEDTGFYRTSKAWGYRSKNDASFHNFRSPSTFSSTAYAGVTKLFGQLGLEHSTNAYASNGATPVAYSMLNIKYLISNKVVAADGIFTFEFGNDGEFLYKNNYCLPIAFAVPYELDQAWNWEMNSNPFSVQNMFLNMTTGIDDVFTPIDHTENGTSATIVTEKAEHVYVYCTNKKVDTITVTINGNDEKFTGINHGRMIDLGYLEANTNITLNNKSDSSENLTLSTYTMDIEKYKKTMTKLAEGGMDVTKHSSTHIEGTVTMKEDQTLFTSIPYDESWTVRVDGKIVTPKKIAGAFLQIDIEEGTHTVTFDFVPKGFKPGLLITIFALLILAGLIAFRVIKKRELTEFVPDIIGEDETENVDNAHELEENASDEESPDVSDYDVLDEAEEATNEAISEESASSLEDDYEA